ARRRRVTHRPECLSMSARSPPGGVCKISAGRQGRVRLTGQGWFVDAEGRPVLGAQDVDGRFVVRFERTYAHPRDEVWRALTEPEVLSTWFDQMIDYNSSRLDCN